ncbi:MAG: bifunctional proline dehydrogenase/L-glutamate gamma-semialdehyde dehydrogenase PutA [Rhodospirillales bacterium]|nr:bifunctional proline dehydrogenase/L-glutamate gamma-semialdehyde dehydrogenase PutA [Rhodospirillales bacterium]
MSQSFSSYFALSEEQAVRALLEDFSWERPRARRIVKDATQLIEAVRGRGPEAGQIESFMRDFALDTEEGLALMTLAEALLRIPDKETRAALIRDKVAAANWLDGAGSSKDWVVKAAGVGLFMTSRTLDGALGRIGEPVVREAMVRAMQMLGGQFVLGQDIEEAMQKALKYRDAGYRMSYDMLGEGARTAADAQHYFDAYAHAIEYIGQRADPKAARCPGISVKLSALHPRYEFAQKETCVPEMAARLLELARVCADADLAMMIDAEECARLNLSLEIFEQVLAVSSLRQWEGFGLAVQAYHKAAPAVIDHIAQLARSMGRRVQMRLVKGAYWDSEIKKAQVGGLPDFPVYTRKGHSDASYLVCAEKMLRQADVIYPMFGTHNAYSAAAVMALAKDAGAPAYEFQRLFGMGRALFDEILKREVPVSIYAPVGPHKDLLPYLVRRLLENGANSSFVNQLLDPDAPVESLVSDPVDKSKNRNMYRHPKIALPSALFFEEMPQSRANSQGVDLDAPEQVARLGQAIDAARKGVEARVFINGKAHESRASEDVVNPADRADIVGRVHGSDFVHVARAYEAAQAGFGAWNGLDAEVRAQALERAADLLELRRAAFMDLLIREAGKTWADAVSEVRETVDFLRYYAGQGRCVFDVQGLSLPGPTGERNRLYHQGRGVFVCISPWNFPLAIFTGQVAAALMAGNAVLAKPAEQTPLIAAEMVKLLHGAGVHVAALHLLPGDGRVGAWAVEHETCAGVAFTGSTEVARIINRALAAKNGPIVPLIAETGGQNAMIVDSSALPEQVVDDVVLSAFGSAGQRCSALRVLCLQDEIAPSVIRMLGGAMAELKLGDPRLLSTDVGPVIDEEAYANLIHHHENLKGFGQRIYEMDVPPDLARKGHFFGPCAYEIQSMGALVKEVFGPILHVIRYRRDDLDDLLGDISGTGYGLTLGVHSRIERFHARVAAGVRAGNVYVNRSMIGAVVGSQPFGGSGLSGTGPKAGGPGYLQRFAIERVMSTDTTAAGGNASLVSLGE